jgi:hypothetical protein
MDIDTSAINTHVKKATAVDNLTKATYCHGYNHTINKAAANFITIQLSIKAAAMDQLLVKFIFPFNPF